MNIYISNLSFGTTDADLNRLFAAFGEVASAKVVMDKFTNRSKGFGFVEIHDETAAKKAIAELNGSMMDGRSLIVNEARPRKEKW